MVRTVSGSESSVADLLLSVLERIELECETRRGDKLSLPRSLLRVGVEGTGHGAPSVRNVCALISDCVPEIVH